MAGPRAFRRITVAAQLAASLALVLVGSGRATAAENEASEALAPGSWSVLFSVQPNFTLGSHGGSTLSLKRHLASGNALRLGLSLGFGNAGDDFSDVRADTFSTVVQSSKVDGNSWSIGVNAYHLWYAGRAAPFHVFWGVGPTISWSRFRDERNESQTYTPIGQPPSGQTSTVENRNRSWQMGFAGNLGIEWLVARRVGLFAEYGSSLVYLSTKSTTNRVTTPIGSPVTTTRTERKANRWDFSGSGGRLGVAAYF